MWGQTNSSASIYQVICTPLDGTSASILNLTGSPTKWSGTSTSGDMIPQVSALVKLTTNERGRSKRGRIFLPWVNEGIADQGTLTSTRQTAMQSAWNTFISDMSTNNCPVVVASYKLASSAIVQTLFVESLLATQRLRQPR